MAAAAARASSFSTTDPCPQNKSASFSAWRCLCTAAAALAPSQEVVLAVCTHAGDCRRWGCLHRRISSLKWPNLRRWRRWRPLRPPILPLGKGRGPLPPCRSIPTLKKRSSDTPTGAQLIKMPVFLGLLYRN
jgi:hypothetical protein